MKTYNLRGPILPKETIADLEQKEKDIASDPKHEIEVQIPIADELYTIKDTTVANMASTMNNTNNEYILTTANKTNQIHSTKPGLG